MDPKISTKFSISSHEESEIIANASTSVQVDIVHEEDKFIKEEKDLTVSVLASASNLGSGSSLIQRETFSKAENSVVSLSISNADQGRKLSAHLNNPSGKRKVKVDWTPELHRQFVQAVEQLGADKAVPSKILELMGIDCLTRHNIASHLQKYRSHRKHLLGLDAEVGTGSRRRQIYGTMSKTGKGYVNSWVVPTMRSHPVTSMPDFRPLHVWGHPSADHALVYMWPSSHLASSSCPSAWAPAHPVARPLPGDPSFWYSHHLQDVPVPGMPCCPPQFPLPRFTTTPVPGLPPTYTHSVAPCIGVPTAPTGQILAQSPFDSQPSKERLDAVIGDVLSKPWLPLPLGLKPPSIDSVMVELQHQGISKIPPSCA